jgi:hypothetical protein
MDLPRGQSQILAKDYSNTISFNEVRGPEQYVDLAELTAAAFFTAFERFILRHMYIFY